jgi:hypothetical protein
MFPLYKGRQLLEKTWRSELKANTLNEWLEPHSAITQRNVDPRQKCGLSVLTAAGCYQLASVTPNILP